MNRHRDYWSVMGIEPYGTHRREMTERLRQELQKLIDIHGLDKVVTTIRELYEKGREKNDE